MFALIPEEKDLTQIYREDEYWIAGYEYGYQDYCDSWKHQKYFYRDRLSQIRSFAPKREKLLEIGSAAGYFLKMAQDDGWQVEGIELSELMRRRSAEVVNCPLHNSIEEVLERKERYDCIILFEVIEHLPDPLATLRQIRKLMNPGALLALSTPNCERPRAAEGGSIDLWFLPPAHVSYFGPKTLVSCVNQSGFETLAIEGLENFTTVFEGHETPLPAWVSLMLRSIRRGKRLRPRGIIGKLLKKRYRYRIDLYKRKRPEELLTTDTLELYARAATPASSS
jgi:2-polyprenyl-3-methyl-5-hydroxy-6-metoxy-1,4-benzoquinol methylase